MGTAAVDGAVLEDVAASVEPAVQRARLVAEDSNPARIADAFQHGAYDGRLVLGTLEACAVLADEDR